ncbi:MAG TPA: hypothetical protein VFD39_05480 [Trueperaceae bacterium]|nr:hypothetical protein [Trueperaceae bacterium]
MPAVALLAVGFVAGGQRTALTEAPPDFPLELVEPGLVGYALTAAAGNVITSFPVAVSGVQYDAGTGFPLVLVRASGPFIERVGGIAAGMSGSPVYLPLDGKDALLGAIGYVFPGADHGVALVTPIAAMRDERVAGALPARVALEGYGVAVPVATPVLLSGADARAVSLLEPLFTNAKVSPLPTQLGGDGEVSAPYSLEPGAAVAVRLMTGDIDLSAIGTLTTVEGAAPSADPAEAAESPPGDAGAAAAGAAGEASAPGQGSHTFLAFGHPFLGTGPASYTLTTAHVVAIIASDSVPFKLANAGRDHLGAVHLDTPTALLGTIGATAKTLPLSLTVLVGGRRERFDVELAAAEQLYPTLAAVAALRAGDGVLRAVGPGHAALAWEIEFSGGERLNLLEQTSSESDIAYAAAVLAGGPLAVLASNPFAEPNVVAVSLSIELSRDRNAATIESLVLEEDPVKEGDNAVLHVRLQPYRRQAMVRTFSVPLPPGSSGEVTLLVRGGDVPRDLDGVPEEGGEVDEPRSFPELLDALRQQLQASELVVEAVDEEGEVERLLRVALPFVVLGSEELTLEVEPATDDSGVEAATSERR